MYNLENNFGTYMYLCTTCTFFCLLQNTKEDILKNVFVLKAMGPKTTLKNIFFCVPKKKESHTGLERHGKL